jgi:peptidyl-prolyl cis-trans isomerase D
MIAQIVSSVDAQDKIIVGASSRDLLEKGWPDNKKGSLEQIAQAYGAGALVENVQDITLATGMLNTAGPDAIALGHIAGLKNGKRSKVFVGENGVFIAEKLSGAPAPALADYSTYKNQIQMMNTQRSSFYINEAIKENANIVDKRYKFY